MRRAFDTIEASDDAARFTWVAHDISNRPRTAATVAWQPDAWTNVGAVHHTPDVSAILQEIVNRPSWSRDDVVFIITGTGERTAEAWDGDSSKAPLLHVEWVH